MGPVGEVTVTDDIETAIGLDDAVGGEAATEAHRSDHSDRIIRVDPWADRVDVLDTRLPSPRAGIAAAAAGDKILLFGGITAEGATDEVLRFDPQDGTLETLPASLPTASFGARRAAAVAPGASGCPAGCVFLLGGLTTIPAGIDGSDAIMRHDVLTGTTVLMPATAPSRAAYSALTTDRGILLAAPSIEPTDHMYRFDPLSGRVEEIGRLPFREKEAGLVERDGTILRIGGIAAPRNAILRLEAT